MTAGVLVALIAVALGSGGIGGLVVARINARSSIAVASTSKPHELVEASAKAIQAFMDGAQAEIERLLKQQAVDTRRLDECEKRHDEGQTENAKLRNELAVQRARVTELEQIIAELHPDNVRATSAAEHGEAGT